MGRGLGWQGDHQGSRFPCSFQAGNLLRSCWDLPHSGWLGCSHSGPRASIGMPGMKTTVLQPSGPLHRAGAQCCVGQGGMGVITAGHQDGEEGLHHPYLCCTETESI